MISVYIRLSRLFLPSVTQLSFRLLLQWGLCLLEGETQYILKQGRTKREEQIQKCHRSPVQIQISKENASQVKKQQRSVFNAV